MPKKSFLDDTKLFPELEAAETRRPPVEAEEPESEESAPQPLVADVQGAPEASKPIRASAKKKAPQGETRRALKQYAYYDSPERHIKLKMWAITSQRADEKDVSSIIRKAVDEFFRKRKSE